MEIYPGDISGIVPTFQSLESKQKSKANLKKKKNAFLVAFKETMQSIVVPRYFRAKSETTIMTKLNEICANS